MMVYDGDMYIYIYIYMFVEVYVYSIFSDSSGYTI